MKAFFERIAGGALCAALWIATALYRLVPPRRAYGFGCAIASLIYPFFPARRRLAVDNILKAGVADSRAEARRIAKSSWRHLAGHIAEALKVPDVVDAGNWREHLDVSEAQGDAAPTLLDRLDEPILLVSSHHGVWEAATNVISFARPMMAVARTLNNRYAAEWMKRHHFRGPVTIIEKQKGFTGEVIRKWLRDKAALTILMDQHAGKRHGLRLSFMGRPAWTFTSAARLGIKYGCPVVVGSFVRTAPFCYRLVGAEPLRFSPGEDLAAATQKLNDRLEMAIRAYPEQYLWMHRRWRG